MLPLRQRYAGTGYLVKTIPQEAIVFQDGAFLTINRDFKITTLLPTRTAQDYKTEELLIHELPLKELRELLQNKPIIALHLQANHPINFVQEKRPLSKKPYNKPYKDNPLRRRSAVQLTRALLSLPIQLEKAHRKPNTISAHATQQTH